MTQKELLYLEDAIGHVKSIISICNESIKMISDEKLRLFLEDEVKTHEGLQNNLMSLLEASVNE